MPTSSDRTSSKFRGTLLGAAIADALALPFQNYSRVFLQSVARPLVASYEATSTGTWPPGQFTDDTQGCLATVDAILERGRLDGSEEMAQLVIEHLIPLWRDLTAIDADPSTTSVVRRVLKGVDLWHEAAHGDGRAECGALARAIPVGLWNAWTPESIPDHIRRVIGVTHRDPRVLATAAGLAAAIGYNASAVDLLLGELLDRVAESCGAFHAELAEAVIDMPRILCQTDARAREILLAVCADAGFEPARNGLGNYCVPVLLLALYEFLKAPQSWAHAVERSLRLGGATCTIAAATGALAGARHGGRALPKELARDLVAVEDIERRIEDFHALWRRIGPGLDSGELETDPGDESE